jgi:hypothetical protein
MKRVATATGLLLFGVVATAYADSPGGWSQYDDLMAKVQAHDHVASVQQVQQAKPVYEFNTSQQRTTSVFPANPNERTNNQ